MCFGCLFIFWSETFLAENKVFVLITAMIKNMLSLRRGYYNVVRSGFFMFCFLFLVLLKNMQVLFY